MDAVAIVPTESGAALLRLEEQAESSNAPIPSRARARAEQADRLIREAQDILDEELPGGDGISPGAEAQRAKNRADFRWKRAASLDRETYGEKVQHEARVAVTVAFPFSLLLPTGAAPMRDDVLIDDARVVNAQRIEAEQRAMLPELREPTK